MMHARMLTNLEATLKFATGGVRDAFIALANTNLCADLQKVQGVLLKSAYPTQEGIRPEEYCSISRFRFFVSSKAARTPGISLKGNTIYTIPMYGLEAAAKIEQNNYTAVIGYQSTMGCIKRRTKQPTLCQVCNRPRDHKPKLD